MNLNVINYFDNLAHNWDEKYETSKYFINRRQELKGLIDKYCKDNFLALDYGCGSGTNTNMLIGICSEVIITDLSKNMLELAKRKFKNEKKIKVLNQNQLEVNRVNLILCSSVIEYAEDEYLFLNNLKSLLNDDGIIIITFPNRFGLLQILNRYVLSLFKQNYTSFQRKTYTVSEIKQMVRKLDLKVLQIYKEIRLSVFLPSTFGELIFCVIKK